MNDSAMQMAHGSRFAARKRLALRIARPGWQFCLPYSVEEVCPAANHGKKILGQFDSIAGGGVYGTPDAALEYGGAFEQGPNPVCRARRRDGAFALVVRTASEAAAAP